MEEAGDCDREGEKDGEGEGSASAEGSGRVKLVRETMTPAS